MSYVPNASDATEPVGSRFVASAAPEFRALKARVNALETAGPGGGGSAALGGFSPANITIDQNTVNGRVDILDTNPLGWNAGVGRMEVQFDVKFNNYFTRNPGGHLAVVLRCDTSAIGTAVRGQGMLFGNVSGAPNGTDLIPSSLLETYFGSTSAPTGGNFLFQNSEGARSKGGMRDNVQYRVIVSGSKANNGQRYLRYALWSWNATYQNWVHEVDTGDVLDHNVWADLTSYGLVFGHVFATAGQTWSIDLTNIKVTWGPCENFTPDQTTKLSRYGAQLEGDLKFIGTRRISTTDWLPVDIAGNPEVVVFKSTTIKLKGASVDLMTPMTRNTGMVGWDNSYAAAFASPSNPMDWNIFCRPGDISTYLGPTYNRGLIENVVRPVCCVVANLVVELRNRRIFKYVTD